MTDSGRTELREWLIHPPTAPLVRNESVLRLFLLNTLDTADRKVLLRGYQREASEAGADIENIIERFDLQPDSDNQPWFGRLAAEYGRRTYAAQLAWSTWAQDQLQAWEQDHPRT
ncbi:hypothetical protein [Fodinicola feengrottensis]|uniref:hypothetical protein n=1 Tax=Fodinicola feengrottensis TaxID=435914 RepID=UPI002442D4B2|nr:hypothetical protein [Fodinicola feengrottensis]